MNTDTNWLNPFTISAVDIHRDAIYTIYLKEVIIKSFSDLQFDYSQQKINSKEFTMTLLFNFYDIEFNLDKSKVLELGDVPQIVQKLR